MVLQAFLLGLVAVWGVFDYQMGTLYTFRRLRSVHWLGWFWATCKPV